MKYWVTDKEYKAKDSAFVFDGVFVQTAYFCGPQIMGSHVPG
jgi:hypothetical protein